MTCFDEESRISMNAQGTRTSGWVGPPRETGISGAYNRQVSWGGDRVAAVTADLRDRLGLALSREHRTMYTLVVDAVHPDPSLVLLTEIGRATEAAPLPMRRQLVRFLALH